MLDKYASMVESFNKLASLIQNSTGPNEEWKKEMQDFIKLNDDVEEVSATKYRDFTPKEKMVQKAVPVASGLLGAIAGGIGGKKVNQTLGGALVGGATGTLAGTFGGMASGIYTPKKREDTPEELARFNEVWDKYDDDDYNRRILSLAEQHPEEYKDLAWENPNIPDLELFKSLYS